MNIYARKHGVYLIGPMVSSLSLDNEARQLWDNHKTKQVEDSSDTLFFASSPHPSTDARVEEFRANFFLTVEKDEGDRKDPDWEHRFVASHKDKNLSLVKFVLLTNREVSHDDALWLYAVYSRRWACETYFLMHGSYVGRSQAKHFTRRSMGYIGGHILLSIFGAWRAYRTRELDDIMESEDEFIEADEDLSNVAMLEFMEILKGQIQAAFVEQKK